MSLQCRQARALKLVLSPLIIDVVVTAAYLCESGEDPFDEVVEFQGAYAARLLLAEDEICHTLLSHPIQAADNGDNSRLASSLVPGKSELHS